MQTSHGQTARPVGLTATVRRVVSTELGCLNWRTALASIILFPLPCYVGNRVRTRVLRLLGFRGIAPNTIMWSLPRITGLGKIHNRLTVGRVCRFNLNCLLNLGAEIRIGDHVGFGHEVMILTDTHHIGGPDYRSGERYSLPVTIGNGCWVGARATILPGVTIGEGAIVAAGSVVVDDVQANTMVAGVPARFVRNLS